MTGGRSSRAIVGLDVGTTGVKAVAFGVGSALRSQAVREYPLLRPRPGREVQDPATVTAAAGEALAECVAGLGGSEVVAVSLSAAMHGLIALDPALAPITPLITWADSRATDEALELRRSPEGREIQATTGAPVHPMTPLTKLIWFSRHDPAIWRAARWWIGLKDLLILWLTGTLATELSSASGTGLLDVSSQSWSRSALDACRLSEDRLAPILSPTTVMGMLPEVAARVGLPAGTPVVAGGADGPLANVGTGAIEPGVAALSLGTSGAVRMTVDQPLVDEAGNVFCYALTGSSWVIGGATSNGADVVRWAGEGLAPDLTAAAGPAHADDSILELAGRVPPGSGGLMMLPFLLPERAPLWNPDAAGAYLGLRRDHTRAHMVRAAVEGVCLQMSLILGRLDSVREVGSVRATGGAFSSQLWRDSMAAAVGRPFHVLGAREGTALGAAALGLHALDPALGLGDALSELGFPADPPPATEPAPALVAAFDRLRASAPVLVGALAGLLG